MILHITTRKDWEEAKNKNEYITASFENEGFIHCSTIKQAPDTANRFFKGQNGLVFLCIEEHKLESICKYEGSAEGIPDNLFPHIYGPLNISSVINVVDFPPKEDGCFELPQELNI